MEKYVKENKDAAWMYAMPHKIKKVKDLARFLGYSQSTLLNIAFDELYEKKKDALTKWLAENHL